jgi:hypothetical protein
MVGTTATGSMTSMMHGAMISAMPNPSVLWASPAPKAARDPTMIKGSMMFPENIKDVETEDSDTSDASDLSDLSDK